MRKLFRKGQTGQSIVILALGFIGLIAVVGITVDVSVLFARYSQLRRAVDAASIAAAGQMREDRTLADVDLTARQFIELHGINPRRVWVESCENAPITDVDDASPGLQPPGGEPLYELDEEICTESQRKLIRVTAEITSETVFLRLVGWNDVELQASAISETAVLDVVVVMDVSESMLTETTYADWAQVNQGYAYRPPIIDTGTPRIKNNPADVSQSGMVLYEMADVNEPNGIPTLEFSGQTWIDFVAGGSATPPPAPAQLWWEDWFWQEFHLNVPQAQVNERQWYTDVESATAATADPLADAALPTNRFYPVDSFIPSDVQALIDAGEVSAAAQIHPREECRTRFYPYSRTLNVPQYMLDLYDDNGTPWPINKWGGFVPTFDYFGCCNDPGSNGVDIDDDGNITPGTSVNPDGNFTDLVCQPFKQAKDATRQFLGRVDFLRGDRVALVTFDRGAFIIDPDGDGPRTHMIEDELTAKDILNRDVGVRTEPNFYVYNEGDGDPITLDGGGWTSGGSTQFAAGVDDNGDSIPIDYGTVSQASVEGNNYPVKDNCLYQNATMPYPFSRYATRNVAGLDQQPALRNVMTPDIYNDPFWSSFTPNAETGLWDAGRNAYELWGQCRGTNIGAALREANNALTDPETSRREGAVWIIIFLGDGAAGASDPVRINGRKPAEPQPYVQSSLGTYDYTTATERHYGLEPSLRGEYGIFGVCPPGGRDNSSRYAGQDRLGELMLTGRPLGEPTFPFCSDESVVTRHICNPSVPALLGGDSSVGSIGPDADADGRAEGPYEAGFGPGARDEDYDYSLSGEENRAAGNVYDLDIGQYTNEENCDQLYDVDDYARDWANFVGGIRPNQEGPGDDATLPTIFTIGFGLNFENDTDPDTGEALEGTDLCNANIEDCLGEELLRYIADVGDNFQVDTDYQQDYLDDGELDGFSPAEIAAGANFGEPDPCEPDDGPGPRGGGYDYLNQAGVQELIVIRDPGTSCGNYYNAPGQEELQLVFDEIASRMFTRIAG